MAHEVTTYRRETNAPDITKYITNISPTDTPFFSMIGNRKAVSRKIESLVDSLTAANSSNALVEGATLSNEARGDRSLEYNMTQIFTKVIEVSGTQEEVMKYGDIKSEMQYQLRNASKEIATDVEKAFIVGTVATGASGTARTLDGAVAKITTNVLTGNVTASAIANMWSGSADADLAAFEDKLNDLCQKAFETGKTMSTVFVGGKLKRRISKLTSKVTRNVNAEAKTQILVVNSYDGDFGTLNIVLNRYVPDTTILAVDLSGWKTAYLRPFSQFELAKTSDSKRFAIVGELSLHADSETYGAKIVVA